MGVVCQRQRDHAADSEQQMLTIHFFILRENYGAEMKIAFKI